MARLARIVVPGFPHHITQRGNRGGTVFFSDEDYQAYLNLLKAALGKTKSEIWAWCLMPNHVHLIVVPSHEDALRQVVADAHRRYARRVNARNQWTGHFWQGRYGSVVLDEPHLVNAIAHISLNPVRAGLVKRAQDWKWSSVHAHLAGKDDSLTTVAPVLSRIPDFAAFLDEPRDDAVFDALRRAEAIGRPLGDIAFVQDLEKRLGRQLQPQKRGPKPKNKE